MQRDAVVLAERRVGLLDEDVTGECVSRCGCDGLGAGV
jgi:hypothetical protein